MTLNGKAIKKRRDELGLTQEQLKERTNVEVRTIQRAEAGTPISNANAALLAQGLGVSVDLLTAGEATGCVDLVELQSGRAFLETLRSNHFVEVDYDFEATGKYRVALTRMGAFIDQNWIDPCKQKREMMFEFIDRGGQMVEFERQVEANEVLGELEKAGLKLLCGTYTAHRDLMVYDGAGNWEPRLDQGSMPYRVALMCVTDGKQVMRKMPTDHVAVRPAWQMAPYAETRF